MEIETKKFEPIDYLTNLSLLHDLGFGREEIAETVDRLELFENWKIYKDEGLTNDPKYLKVYEIIKDRHSFQKEVFQGEYSKKITVTGYLVRIPHEYQRNYHGIIIHDLMCKKFPWFASFQKKEEKESKLTGRERLEDIDPSLRSLTVDELLSRVQKHIVEKPLWKIYSPSNIDDEIYLETEFGTLYVPLKVFTEFDTGLIEKRMTDYFSWYYDFKTLKGYSLNARGRTEEEYLKDMKASFDNALKPLESREYILLKGFIEEEKTKALNVDV